MICKNYETLSPKERTEFIGQLLHAVQNDNRAFNTCKMLVSVSEKLGVFTGIKINPDDFPAHEKIYFNR